MVVSYFNSYSLLDYFHKGWRDFINIKDICVIWGQNLDPEVYQKMSFKTQAWSCQYRWPNREVGAKFNKKQLSNNHLLTNNPELSRVIKNIRKGDQISLVGQLVSYSHDQGFHRGTSTTRNDQGNRACETIWVNKLEIVREANMGWRHLYRIGLYSLAGLFLSLILTKKRS